MLSPISPMVKSMCCYLRICVVTTAFLLQGKHFTHWAIFQIRRFKIIYHFKDLGACDCSFIINLSRISQGMPFIVKTMSCPHGALHVTNGLFPSQILWQPHKGYSFSIQKIKERQMGGSGTETETDRVGNLEKWILEPRAPPMLFMTTAKTL